MKEKKHPTEYDLWQEQPQTYQTGSTHPPKSYRGIMAFLLVLVIFLCGISTALGLMNIRLFRALSSLDATQQTDAVSFAEAASVTAEAADEACVLFSPGFTGQSVPVFWQHYHDLPQGIYITQVDAGSAAETCGLLPGDVLIRLDGIPTESTDALSELLDGCSSGQRLDAEIFRDGNTVSLTLTIE